MSEELPNDPRIRHTPKANEAGASPKASQAAEAEGQVGLDERQPTPWRVEEWRGRYLVMREVPVSGSPMMERQLDGHGKGQFSRATVYEEQEAAAARVEVLNSEGADDVSN